MEAILVGVVFPMVLIFGLMYLTMIRPQKKQETKRKEMVENLVKGDRVRSIGGIVGTISAVNDDTVLVRSGSSDIEFMKDAIAVKREVYGEEDTAVTKKETKDEN